ncbi:MAG: AAA family ATPase [Candidatus Riflebacteria bacterium]|nr:AAA family ATPase [Candidatus Riflebacteria bacterium]
MLTKLIVRNFKRFGQVEIELGNPVIFIGPNNSGKTSALQAMTLWHIGLAKWTERRKGKSAPEKRPGVTINRRDLLAVPVPDANLLWRNLHVRNVQRSGDRQRTQNVCVEVVVEGVTAGNAWTCGLEFDYANEESFYCRPLRLQADPAAGRMPVPDEAASVQLAFLPPMSGLAATEDRLDPGAVNVRIGEGRTAEVLRNLCHRIYEQSGDKWTLLSGRIESLFSVTLEPPIYVADRGQIVMQYRERGCRFDLSCTGRGLQQTLLLLAYMYANPGAVLLLDEPDAHLEILRQRENYQVLCDVAKENENQLVAASHSEILLNEAAERDVVVAFVGRPHRIDDRGSQLRKSLASIGFEDYYQAEQNGWVLYLEGSTDLAILQALAATLGHAAALHCLRRPFVKYVGNVPRQALSHFHGLREAVDHLQGVAVFDRLSQEIHESSAAFLGLTWRRREIENYLCTPEVLEAYARAHAEKEYPPGTLFSLPEVQRRVASMQDASRETAEALDMLKNVSPWSVDTKVSEDFLEPLFRAYFRKLGLPNLMAKKNFHELAAFVPPDKIDPEICEKLDAIARVAASARPAQEE